MLRYFYLFLCLVGTILPYTQFLPFFRDFGIDFPLFFQQSFANYIARGLSFDILISSIVFWVFLFKEGTRLKMKYLWVYVVCNLSVGLSLGLPLFLYVRELKLEDKSQTRVSLS